MSDSESTGLEGVVIMLDNPKVFHRPAEHQPPYYQPTDNSYGSEDFFYPACDPSHTGREAVRSIAERHGTRPCPECYPAE